MNVELLKEVRFIVLNGVGLSVDRDAASFTPCESSEVVLSGGDLSLSSSTITSSSKLSKFRVVAIKFYEQKIVLEFESYLPRGQGVLDLVFSGEITKGLFIRSARRLFPCWDEPVYKARFTISMELPVEFAAVSNMPILEEKVEGNRKLVSYHESPNMATYLVTMIAGPLQPDIEQVLTLQQQPLSSRGLKQTVETKILDGDIVMNRETEKVSRVGREDDKLFLFPIDKAEKEELRKDEVIVVSRPFFHGQPVCLVTDHLKLGIICGIDMRVDLASSDGKTIAHRDIGTESLERNRRFFVGDTVVLGSWFGAVEGVELKMKVHLETGVTITALEAETEDYEPIFKTAAESYLDEPYYVGQEVIIHGSDVPLTGVITQHKAHMVVVKWIHCNPLREEKEPAKTFWYGYAQRIHDPRATSSFWSLGSRCIFEGKEFLIAGVRSMVKVKWQEGFVEEISSTKLVESGEFFSGQFVAKKEGEGVGFVRFVVDGIAWVEWVKEEKPELVPISELQPHAEYRFHISDVVAKKSGSGDRGFVVGMGNGKLEVEWWLNKTITVVQPEEIYRLCYSFGEDTSEEGSSDDDTPAFPLGPVAIASSGSVLLEPASSTSSSDEDDDDTWG